MTKTGYTRLLDLLRHPRRNALLLGLLQGVPQGLNLAEKSELSNPVMDKNLVIIVLFGLCGPPILMALSYLTSKGSHLALWRRINSFVNLSEMMFWGGISLGGL